MRFESHGGVLANNEKGLAFYNKMGFEIEGVQKRAWLPCAEGERTEIYRWSDDSKDALASLEEKEKSLIFCGVVG